jgi:hypothetical protein
MPRAVGTLNVTRHALLSEASRMPKRATSSAHVSRFAASFDRSRSYAVRSASVIAPHAARLRSAPDTVLLVRVCRMVLCGYGSNVAIATLSPRVCTQKVTVYTNIVVCFTATCSVTPPSVPSMPPGAASPRKRTREGCAGRRRRSEGRERSEPRSSPTRPKGGTRPNTTSNAQGQRERPHTTTDPPASTPSPCSAHLSTSTSERAPAHTTHQPQPHIPTR